MYKKVVCAALFLATTSVMAAADAADANNRFGLNLYQEVKRSESSRLKNTFISPVSAFLALSMTANGAAGDTERAIMSTISAANMTREELNRANQELMSILNAGDKDFTLEVANSMWTRNEFRFRPEFVRNVEARYQATARSLDFNDPESSDIINGWVSEKTHGKIKDIVEKQLRGDFYLVNATYFKAAWTYPFTEEATKHEDFHVRGTTKKVDMMHDEPQARYVKAEGYEAVQLGYGEQGASHAILILPTGSLEDLEPRLNHEEWQKISLALASAHPEQIRLALPKFKFEYESDLKPVLSNMGMEIAFSPLANFFDLSPSGIVLHKALQKTFVAVDEKGTEAAAATIIGGVTSVPPPPKVDITFNRPFLFAINETKSGALLFLGSVSDPEFKE